MNIDKTLSERQVTHGSFAENAGIAQAMRAAVQTGSGWAKASPVQREAIHNVIGKIARLAAGDPTFEDTWQDISGYSNLAYKDVMNQEVER